MLLDLNKLSTLPGSSEHFERTFQPTMFEPQDEDYSVVSPVQLAMDIRRLGTDAFQVSGRFTTLLEMVCSRCVEPFRVPVDAPFDLRYLPQTDNEGDPEREIGDADLATAFYSDGTLDIGDLLREQFQLTLPMKPLCLAACKGLCIHCGTNLNTAPCDCAPVWEDPRLALLKGLLNRDKED